MTTSTRKRGLAVPSAWAFLTVLWTVVISLWSPDVQAIPAFNRQTGQNCVACHAGGQFPELTPYGRLFKLTGYTIGERALPISAMALVSMAKVADTTKSSDPGADFQKNNRPILATASLLLGGKVTDHIGGFVQITYDPYATQDADGTFHGHSNADNIDLRYADRMISSERDLIFGLSANNNPSVSDPWNTASAWMQYVPVASPTSHRFVDGNAPYPGFGSGGNIAGLTAYAYWNQRLYLEVGGYGTSKGVTSFMSAGLDRASTTQLRGINPYWRLAFNTEWGAHSLMVGAAGMVARVYDDPLDTSDPASTHRYADLHLDTQYQYQLDPHAVTVQVVYAHSQHRYPASLVGQPAAFFDASGEATLPGSNATDTTNLVRAKLGYSYQARYGGSLGVFNLTGTSNTAAQTAGYDATGTLTQTAGAGSSLSGNPATRGWTLETFWMPIQYLRVGAQYTAYSRYNGAASNYDGLGRNARDNDTLFLYTWLAY